jgi:prefoldin subunit 5
MRNAIAFSALLLLCSCRDPRAEANIAQAMTEVGTTISQMQQDYSLLQSEVDSLRQVVAKQDTIIRRLSTLAGLP